MLRSSARLPRRMIYHWSLTKDVGAGISRLTEKLGVHISKARMDM